MWINLLDGDKTLDPIAGQFDETVATWPDVWAQHQIRLYPDAPVSITSFPTLRYEFNRLMFYMLGLSVNLHLIPVLQHTYRRSIYILHSEVDENPEDAAETFELKRNDPIVVYVNINLANQPPLAKRTQTFQDNQPKLAPAPYKTIIESVIARWLNTFLPRCVPQIKTVDIIQLQSHQFQPHDRKEPSKVVQEWAVQAQGSSLEGCAYRRHFVRTCPP